MTAHPAVRQQNLPAATGGIDPATWSMYMQIVEQIAATEFVPAGLRGKKPAILACMLYGNALGLDPMIALREITVINGKPSLSAALVTARIREAGHHLTREEHRDEKGELVAITAHGRRSDGDEDSFRFGIPEARAAGLLGGGNYSKYPTSMFWSRAVTQLARMLFADVFLGAVYTPEELGGEPDQRDIEETRTSAAVTSGVREAAPGPAVVITQAGVVEPRVVGEIRAQRAAELASPAGVEEPPADAEPSSSRVSAEAAPRDPSPVTDEDALNLARRFMAQESADTAEASMAKGIPDHALPFVLPETVLEVVTDQIGTQAPFIAETWPTRGAEALVNRVREEKDANVLQFFGHVEATTKARKGVLTAIGKRLEGLAAPNPRDAGDSVSEPRSALDVAMEAAAAAGHPVTTAVDMAAEAFGDDEPDTVASTEALLAFSAPTPKPEVTPLVRLRALIAFVKDQPSAVDAAMVPFLSDEAGVLKAIEASGYGRYESLDDLPPEDVNVAWMAAPKETREHIEALSDSDVLALAEESI